MLYGTGFRHHCPRGDGTAFEIVGEPRGGAAYLSIRPASEEARALKDAEAALDRAGAELRFLRDVLDRAPVIAWSHGPDGQVAWANAAYRDRFDAPAGDLPDHRIANAFGHVLEEVPLTARGADSRRRVSVPGRGDAEPRWYEISQSPGPSGETLGFALDADDLVAAEASLRRFVETLTETFAHLPIGLAVFDKNRRLGLFNPALTDLVKIDAVWLAGRPSPCATSSSGCARPGRCPSRRTSPRCAASSASSRRARATAPTRRTGSCPRARSSGSPAGRTRRARWPSSSRTSRPRSSSSASTAPSSSSARRRSTGCPRRWRCSTPRGCSSSSTPPSSGSGASTRWSGSTAPASPR